MVDIEAVSQWLKARLATDLISEIWIFGSAVHALQSFNDVDVFVKYLDDHSASIPNLKREVEEGFSDRFGVPLHILFLNNSESKEAEKFLESALCHSLRVR